MVYNSLKRVIKSLFPKELVYSLSPVLRSVWSVFYTGNSHSCNICGKQLSRFIEFSSGELMCPKCGSLRRSRRLFMLIYNEIRQSYKVLHLSPERCISEALYKDNTIQYVTSDYIGEFHADRHFDLRCTGEPDNSYDLIVCYHILEHIAEDTQAMHEMYRMLKPGGKCLIQTPFGDGEIIEDFSIVTPEDRTAKFGQSDHVRIYSPGGLTARLESAGFDVVSMVFGADEVLGLINGEIVIVAQKK